VACKLQNISNLIVDDWLDCREYFIVQALLNFFQVINSLLQNQKTKSYNKKILIADSWFKL
jgi:hypothetical protein